MRRTIALILLCLDLLSGAAANYEAIAFPEIKLTTYYRTHSYPDTVSPETETDVAATLMKMAGINVIVFFVAIAICLMGGLSWSNLLRAKKVRILDLKDTVDPIISLILNGRAAAAGDAIHVLRKKGLFEEVEKLVEKNRGIYEAKILDLDRLIRDWALSPNPTQENLLEAARKVIPIEDRLLRMFIRATYRRFVERLQAAQADRISAMLRNSKRSKLAEEAPLVAGDVFDAMRLGLPSREAVWTAITESLW